MEADGFSGVVCIDYSETCIQVRKLADPSLVLFVNTPFGLDS
jgi:hypothetical protein